MIDETRVVVGATLHHVKYGAGTVTDVTTAPGQAGRVATVDFGDLIGQRRFLVAYAPLTLDPDPQLAVSSFEYEDFEKDVRDELRKALLRKSVQAAVLAEQAAANPAPPFDAGTVGEILDRPAPPPMRIEGLAPSEGGLLVTAARKAGKTTFELNLAHSLITGQDFLGRFGVRPIDGDIAILNYEVSGDTLARWADEHGVDRDRCYLVNLRGRRNPLANPDDRRRLADELRARGTEALIVDPFGRAFTGKNQNDPGEVGAWLVDLDLFARGEVGATEVVLSAHAGWNGERTRGSSALEDWADSIVWITRDQDDDSQRFMRAEGRDVLIDEDRLDYSPTARTLTLAGVGSRRKSKDDRKLAELAVFVVRAARHNPGAHLAALEGQIKAMEDAPTFRNGEVSKAAKYAQERGLLRVEIGGAGRRNSHYAVDPITPPNPSQTHPGEHLPTPPTPPYRGGVGVGAGSNVLPLPDRGSGS